MNLVGKLLKPQYSLKIYHRHLNKMERSITLSFHIKKKRKHNLSVKLSWFKSELSQNDGSAE